MSAEAAIKRAIREFGIDDPQKQLAGVSSGVMGELHPSTRKAPAGLGGDGGLPPGLAGVVGNGEYLDQPPACESRRHRKCLHGLRFGLRITSCLKRAYSRTERCVHGKSSVTVIVSTCISPRPT